MSCYECIHINVCRAYEPEYVDCICNQFKNKADVGEVVRCKACKYYEVGKSYTPYCNNVMNLFEEMKPDDFCSYGERK